MNTGLLVVREVRLQRRCWPIGDADGEPTIVCPLCALEKHQSTEKTADYSRTGYISCFSCGRMSSITTAGGVSIVPVSLETVALRQLANALAALKAALQGSGELLALVTLDMETPTVTVSFALEKLRLTPAALEGGLLTGDSSVESATADEDDTLRDSPFGAGRPWRRGHRLQLVAGG